jgi:molybdate transport system substrate-binding protein
MAVTIPLAACQNSQSANGDTTSPITLNISASAVMVDVIKEIDSAYSKVNPNVSFVTNFASGGTIQLQIENGAACDVFISAASSFMDNLQKEGLLMNETRANLLSNKIVLIVPGNSTLSLKDFNGLTSDKIKSIAIGDPKSVSAGSYAQQTFDLLGITSSIQSKFILSSDVRQVLNYVETGNVDAGVVFATDAMTTTTVNVVATAPDEINAKIIYSVSAIKATKNVKAAEDYISFLQGNTAKAIFEKYGFTVISK